MNTAQKLRQSIGDLKVSTDFHNDNLIGKEGTPEYKVWRQERVLLQKSVGDAWLEAKQNATVHGPPSWACNPDDIVDGKVKLPPGMANAAPGARLHFLGYHAARYGDVDELDLTGIPALMRIAEDECENG